MINWRKYFGKILRKTISALTVLAVIFSSFGPVFTIPSARAAVTIVTQPTEMIFTAQKAKASSANIPIAKFKIGQSAAETLSSVTVIITSVAGGVTSSEIANLKVYKDQDGGMFDAEDLLAGTQTTVNIGASTTITTAANNTIGASAAETTFFVTFATSATWSDAAPADAISVSMAADGVVVSTGPLTTDVLTGVNALVADTTGPSILSIEKVSPSAVEVAFSETLQTNTAMTKTNYTFTNTLALTVVDSVQQGPNYKIVASGDITAGVTTLTVGAGVLDMAGNANTITTAQDIAVPIKVKISEFSANMGSEDAEFVEIYNAGGSAVNIDGWKLQYKTASGGSFADIAGAVVPDIPDLDAGKFYLFSTAAFDAVSAVDGDAVFTAGLELAGGHIKLMNGATEIDKIGWGTADSAEGNSPVLAHASGESIERKSFGGSNSAGLAAGGMDANMGNGWDTNNNSFDLVVQALPSPQNSSSGAEIPSFGGYGGPAGNGPMINHMPVNFAPTAAALNLIAQAGDPMTPMDQVIAELHYMVGDASPSVGVSADFTTVLGVHQSNGYFKFTIPSGDVTVNKVYYYLKVVTDGGTGFMSTNPMVDMGAVPGAYATIGAKENAVAANPFVVNVAAAGVLRTITGTITNGGGALVFLEGTGYNATANDGGVYTITAQDGIYNLVIIKSGYYEEWVNNIFLNSNTTVSKTLNAGQGGGMTGDNVKPMVNWSGPPDGMFGIPTQDANFKIFIGFSKDLDPATFIPTNVYLTTDGTTPIVSVANYDPADRTNMPPDPYLGVVYPPTVGGFISDTTYYLVMTGDVRDTSGNSLQGNRPEGGHVISFTTGGSFTQGQMEGAGFGTGAMMPPFVMGVTPSNGAMDVVTNAKINISFSDPMDSTSVNTTNIKLYRITVSGTTETKTPISLSTVTLDTSGKVATLTPSSALTAGKHRVAVTGALKSATGIWMGNPGADPAQNTATYEFYKSAFEVGTSSDATAPTVLGSWPANDAIDISVNPGMLTIQFSEGMSLSTITSNTITLKRGTSSVTGNVNYDPMSQSASFSPGVVLATSADYTFTVTTGVTDAVGTALAQNYVVNFTTKATGDGDAPSIMFANGDEYGVAITFSEAMNAAKITDATNWGASVLKASNYVIKQGPAGTSDWAAGAGVTTLDLSGAKFNYDGMSNTVMIDSLSGTTVGNDYYIDMSASLATDLSGNLISAGSPDTFRMPINSSATTNGMLGPMMGGGMGGPMGPNMGNMGMMKAGVFPMNAMAGQTTIYFVDVPTTKAIPSGGKIVLIFPTGFDVTAAAKDATSPVNNDINEWNAGTITIASVAADQAARKITITTGGAATQANDFLHMDIKGIINSSIPRGFETSGYSVDMKTMDDSGNLLETITGMPFFINAGGANSLVVTVNGVTSGDNGDVSVFLGSPMTGPMEKIVTFLNETSDTATFSSLPAGQYMLFTEPTITLGSSDYAGMPMPQSITIDGANTKTIVLVKEAAGGGNATITVDVNGVFGTDDIDVFAGSPTGFKVKTITNAGTNPANVSLYLPDGNWMIGIGPAMPKGPMSGPPPMPNWMPPMPVNVVVSGSGTVVKESSDTPNDGTVLIAISSATMEIVGYVQDGSGNAIADAEAFAYQPMGAGMGAHAKTDTDGKFTLKVATAGTYSVGVFKPGLPGVPDRTVKVGANESITGGDADGNTTADIKVDGVLITAANKFIFKIQKSSTTISGKVTNGTDPVAYAPVWAYQTNGSTGHADTMTDSSGSYILYVGNGTWTVQSYVPGYGDSESQIVVVNGSSMTQNLAPTTGVTYYTISGTITINGAVQTFMPIRAVKYDDNGNYTGQEYGGQTDAVGVYKISVPAGKYRVDTWTPEYGEVGLATDGVSNSPANINVIGNVSTAHITIAGANLKTMTFSFTNGTASQTAIIDIDGVAGTPPKPTGFHKTIKLSTLAVSSSVALATGDYMFQMNVPGIGFFMPVGGNPVTVSADGPVTFTLPVATGDEKTVFTISGTIRDAGASPISGAWVWMGNPTTGVHFGTTTANNGTYSLAVKSGTYNMGVEMPGYIPETPTLINVLADDSAVNYVLVAASQFIVGRIYADTVVVNNSYDSGEEIANGWVFVEETTTKKIAGAPTGIDGVFSIGVGVGTFTLKGTAEGYSETKYGSPIITAGEGASGKNIKLTVDANWSSKLKSKPMTPASGGTMDDSLSTGTGVKLVVPPNALGSSTSSGNIKTNEVSSVSKTSSAQPLGSKGKEITAQDNSGQAITTLNDDIEIELNYYKEDVVEANVQDMSKLDQLTNSYWDASVGDWIPMSTTKKAYTKAVGNEAEWTAQSDFSAFVDALQANADAYGDYKISLQSTSNHLTIFGATIPSDLTAPAAPSGLAQTSGTGTSVVLDWANNSEADLLEYEVYRSASASVAAINANQKNSSQLLTSAFTDSTASAWTSYYYTITAVDDSGNESAVAAEVRMCSNKTVSNGTVANTCVITCDTGYTLSGNSCAADIPAATPAPSSGGGYYVPPATTITGGSISIAGGAANTAGTAVTLTLAATNAATMAISNVSDFAGAAWEIYTTSKAWILSAGDGLKTVYAKFRDAAGVASSAVFDTITLGNVLTPSPAPASSSTSYPDGTLLKSSDAPEVYVIKSGNKVWVATAEEFNAAGYKWGDIKVVSGEVLKAVGSVKLIRVAGDSRVYVLHNNKKTHIKSAEEFSAAGYKWENIILVSQAEADSYIDGIAAIGKTIIITPLWLRVRALNTTNSAELGRVNKGENYSVLEENNNWYKIQTAKGIIGWVSGAYTTVKTASAANSVGANTIVVNALSLRVRSINSTAGKILGAVKKGTVLSVLEESNGWYKITTSGGITGWILGSYVTKQ